MKKIANLAIAVLLFFLYGCEEIVNLDLSEKDPRIVVDGLITNQDTAYYVKLTKTNKYSFKYDTLKVEYEKGALVIVTDNLGNIDTLKEISSGGIYKTHPNKMIGVIGRMYHIDIFTQAGKHYKSDPEEMLDVPKIDSIYCIRDRNKTDPAYPVNYLYDIYIDWHDPQNTQNYYLWNVSYYWSGQWQNNFQWISVFSDKYIDGNDVKKYLVQEGYGGYNWDCRVEQYSLSQKAYNFWNLVFKQTQSTGSTIANTTVPLIGNVSNAENPDDYALGYFQVSAKSSATVKVEK